MTDPRVCIVGAGQLSSRRIYPYIGLAGGQLVGTCDLDRTKAEQNARRFGGRAYIDLEQMLDTECPDGVIICIGPEEHAVLATRLLQKGIPVYTEKPPALSAVAALEVVRVARKTGVLCMTAFKKRYTHAYARAKEWMNNQWRTDLLSISIDYASGHYANENKPATSFLLDFAIHCIDLIGFLGGEAAEVFCFAQEGHAYAVSLRFRDGGVGTLNLNDGRSFIVPTEEVEITFRGGNFMTIHNSSCWHITENGQPTEWREPPTFTSAGDSGNDTGHLAELTDFLCAIREGRGTRSEIAESYKSMVLYEAIKESAETRSLVSVSFETV